ncbi:serine/threonine-protein kinase [Pyxidicoccus sp. MSG2]|uniref:serine/threonine-protein kinase n=1 Tax=Pyxidicoccus sp. MSG2 TaxID=2996790 RepID=UPI002271B31B|nr:serine/threonine-protein kinase [Pyxidicoccus sp. MSG2]MCY1020138.1 protein kinase [Pyxidicoccus sp. MSG2]
MREAHEAELGLALAEGVLGREEADALGAEARRLGQSPLELLVARGKLSDETLLSLRGRLRGGTGPEGSERDSAPAAEGPPTEGGVTPAPMDAGALDFPVPDWDRYQPVRLLGQGGMGRVFLAYDLRLRRHVALKFVRGDDVELARRFVAEARAQARVRHQGVCQVYEVGEVQGRVYIAMQYVDGQPLGALVRVLTAEQKALVLRDAAEGVHAAHHAGLIHRDLKPSNILVERAEDGALRTYVLDFGLARDWKDGHTASGTVLGTPHYMAPEQARGETARLDRRADVYGLGATLYHLMTGEPPIPGDNGLEVLANVATVEPRPPRALDADLPADLEAITLKCLEKDRSARYDSARALAEDLERFLSGEPVRARAAGAWYRLRKRLHRHRRLAALAVAALAVVGVAVGQAVLARREVAERERLARRFTERVENIEALARYSGLAPLHDTRADRKKLRARMRELETELATAGAPALGPGHFALGRGHLALGDEAAAREHLETAWEHGFREPRLAYALALVLGHQYQARRLEAERLREVGAREALLTDLRRRYRDPALAYLRLADGAETPSPAYVPALIDFYEDRLDEALARLNAGDGGESWSFEVPLLQGDILLARATRRWNEGRTEEARADFEAGRRAHAAAAAIGESVPAVYLARAQLEYAALVMELYGKGDVAPPFARATEALSHALTVAPDDYAAHVLKASLHRRLAEQRTGRGEDARSPLDEALSSARAALALAPGRPEARLELGLSLWQRARDLLGHGEDPREALQQAAEAFESIGPEERDYHFHANLGLVFKLRADHEDQTGGDPLPYRDRSIASYRAALQLDEHLPDAWINLGAAYLRRASHSRGDGEADLARAAEALGRARALNPGQLVPYFQEGQVFEELARRKRARGGETRPDLERALAMYQQGIAINPSLAPLHFGVGAIHIARAREAREHGGSPFPLLDEAEAAYARGLALAPKGGLGDNNLGEVHAWRARYQRELGGDPGPSARAAVEAYQRAIERLPRHAVPRANLGRVLHTLAAYELEHGKDPRPELSRAEEALRRALELNPRETEAWRSLGEVHTVRAGWLMRRRQAPDAELAAAEGAFTKALELAPDDGEARLAFGSFWRTHAEWRAGTGQDAKADVERGLSLVEAALATRPGWAEAVELRARLRALSPSR